jgi:DNA-binding YbaB/EbfC family protein
MMPNAKQIQQLQARLAKIQEQLGKETVTASVSGVVSVTMTGHHEVREVKIDPAAVDPDDVESLEDALVTAFNQALEKASDLAQERMGPLTGGMRIPGM